MVVSAGVGPATGYFPVFRQSLSNDKSAVLVATCTAGIALRTISLQVGFGERVCLTSDRIMRSCTLAQVAFIGLTKPSSVRVNIIVCAVVTYMITQQA